ncbi:MAG TPA: sulfotransferase domain-containing protein, partial [Rhodopila sp.]|nr:sulfotransferase domain-containing protein [Rhodopila sp.]
MGQLVWIASYPKSGNTWMRAFLHNYIRNAETPHDINRLTDLTAADINAERYQRYDPRPASQYGIADVQRMRPLVHRDLTELDSTLVFVKTHNARMQVAGAPLITPAMTAGAVYIVRDPRDIAISYSRHRGRSLDETIAFMAHPQAATGGTDTKVFEFLSNWSTHVNSWTNTSDPRVQVVRYEAMASDPTAVFGAVIGWLGQAPAAERLQRAIRFSAFEELQIQEKTSGFRERTVES